MNRERAGIFCFLGGSALGLVFILLDVPFTGPHGVWPTAIVLALLVAGAFLLDG